MRTVAIIPARGGSKGIPNKNLRPLRGKPLIGWVIEAARAAKRIDAVVVSTESKAIAATARRLGAEVVERGEGLAGDEVTLDPVIADAVVQLERAGRVFDVVLTIQPTSPLVRSSTIDSIVARFEAQPELCTVLTVVDDTHLAWTRNAGVAVPAYERRLNRQQLPPRLRETGGVVATRRSFVRPEGRFGPRIDLEVLSQAEGCDIDSIDDWVYAEALLGRRRVAFLPIGNRRQGLGHVTRVMSLMECMTGHVVQAFCDPGEDLAVALLASRWFPHEVVGRSGRLAALRAFAPDVIVHDELDTLRADLEAERALGAKLVCFEDLGAGMELADLVFNELYPAERSDPGHGRTFGPQACVLREEFLHVPRNPFRDEVARVLVTFGGTDPSGLTLDVLDAVGDEVRGELVVVAGKGVDDVDALRARCERLVAEGRRVLFHRDVQLMSEVMAGVDLAFSSAGRTLYELAHMQVPTIVLAQNELELKHAFGGPENGFLPLGLGRDAGVEAIRAAFRALSGSPAMRKSLWERMHALDLTTSRDRVVRAILEV